MRRLLLRCLPADWRTSIEGDLEEEGGWIAPRLFVIVAALAVSRCRERLRSAGPPRPLRWFADARRDVRYGLRRWWRQPAFTGGALATLAIGIGTTSALFCVVDGVLLKPLPYPHPDRLVVVNRTYPEWVHDPILASSWDRISFAWPEFFHVRDHARTIEALAVTTTRLAVTSGTSPQELRVGVASASFFRILGVGAVRGTLFRDEDDRRDSGTVVVSHAFWQSRLGADPSVIGRRLRLRGGDRAIAGVLPPDFTWGTRELPYPIWYPLAAIPENERADNNRNLDAIARLRPGVTRAEATDEMSVLLREHFRFTAVTGAAVTPLMERQLRRVRAPLLLLLAGAVLLMVIACANVAGLLTGDAAGRERELAIRASLGATGGRVMRQLVAETLVLTAAGSAAGLLAATWGVRALVALAPADMPRLDEIAVDWRVAAVAMAAAFVTAVLFAFVPAVSPRSDGRAFATAAAGRASTARRRWSAALPIVQIALSVALLTAAGLFARSLAALEHVDTGFDRSHLLTLRAGLPPTQDADGMKAAQFFDRAADALRQLPGVSDVAVTSNLAFASGRASTTISLDGTATGKGFEAQRRTISTGYFRALRIPVLSGRTFGASDTSASAPVAVVSREMERRIWPEGAVGRTFTYAGARHTVVGVVGDLRELALDSPTQPTFYLPMAQRGAWPMMRLIVRTSGEPWNLSAMARETIARVDPDVPVEDVRSMDDLIYTSTDDERYRAVLMVVFASAAALLAAVGLYGTLARRVADRYREIGVRMALGARAEQVRGMFLGEGLRLAAMGTALGIPIALALGRAAASLLFGVGPFDAATLGVVVAAVAALAVAATYIPSAHASRTDPVTTLRRD